MVAKEVGDGALMGQAYTVTVDEAISAAASAERPKRMTKRGLISQLMAEFADIMMLANKKERNGEPSSFRDEATASTNCSA